MDWMISPKMNTEQMSTFLSQVGAAHPEDFIIMVLDGAGSHKAKGLQRPENIRLVALPLMPRNSTHKSMCGMNSGTKSFPIGCSSDLAAVTRQLRGRLPRLSAGHEGLRSLTA